MAKRQKSIVLEGRNMIHDALNSTQKIEVVIISSAVLSDPKIKEIEALAKSKKVRIQMVKPDELSNFAESRNPQGVVAYMEQPELPNLEVILKNKRNAFILLLNQIDYEQNLGAIMRTAWAAGIDAIVASPNGIHEISSVVAKVSMGGAAHVPLIGMSLFQAIKLIHEYAVPLVGIEVDKGETIYKTNLRGPIAFLMGGEEVGITEPLEKECDLMANIPMNKELASLNVSVATALVLFEKLRQENPA